MSEITSRTNPRFKRWLSLTESKGIRKEGLCLLSGKKLVNELLQSRPELVVEILLPPKGDALNAFDGPQVRLTSELFKEIDVIGTRSPIAVVKTSNIPEWQQTETRGLEVIAALSDPGNLGGLLRSAHAFGVRRVILTEESASPFLPKTLRASAGISLNMEFAYAPSIKNLELKNSAIGLDMDGEDLNSFSWPANSLLVLGEEGQGLPDQLNLQRLKIPMRAGTESLNAMVAASIAMFAYASQHPVKN